MNGSVKTYASRMYLILLLAKVNFENATKRLRYSIKNKNHRHTYYELFYMKVIYPHKLNNQILASISQIPQMWFLHKLLSNICKM